MSAPTPTPTDASPAAGTRPRRGRGRRIGRALAIAFGVLLVAGGVIELLEALTSDTTTTEESYRLDAVDALVLDGEAGDVTVTVEDRADVVVRTRVSDNLFADAEVRAEIVGATLELESDCGSWLHFGCSVEYTLAVPSGFAAPVAIDTTAANVALTGVQAPVTAATTAGDIDLDDYRGEIAQLETTAGDVSVQASTPPTDLSVRTTAGGVEVVVPDEVYDVEADTTAGDVDVQVRQDPASPRRIDVATTAGDVSVTSR